MNTATALKKVAVLSVVVLLLCLVPHSQAQQDTDPASDRRQAIKFEHLTMEHGLSTNFSLGILQDSQGFIWFGTKDGGLNKYNGSEFAIYVHDPDDPNSLSNNYAFDLIEGQDGTLWVCTWGSGLDKFDPATETFTHYPHDENNPNSLSNNLIWSVYEDSDGWLWIATDGGLNKFDPANENFVHYQHDPDDPQSLSTNSLTHIYADRAGILWVGSYGAGMNKFDPVSETAVRYRHDPDNANSLSNDNIWAIEADSSGMLWIGTESGVDKFDPASETFTHYQYGETDPDSLSYNTVTDIIEDRNGMLWMSTFGGLNRFDPVNEKFSRFLNDATDPHSLSNDLVWYLLEDNTGTVWASTDNGVNKYDPGSERFAHYQHNPDNPDSLAENLVSAIYEDADGILWIGTKGGGLDKFDRVNNTFIHYQHDDNNPNSPSNNNIIAIHPDSSGVLWLGTEGGGFDKFDPLQETFIHYQNDPDDPNALSNDGVADIDIDSAGIVWVGTYGGGLNRFDPESETFKLYTHDENDPQSLTSPFVRTVLVDSTGAVWVGSEGSLSRFDPGSETFINYLADENDPTSLSNDTIGTIYEDSRGILWIGTNHGLNKFDSSTGTFSVYRDKQGLAGNGVSAILEDEQGVLWVGTTDGLSRFDPQAETFRNYDVGDGLQGDSFLLHSAYKSASGELFLGGVGGFNAFYPDRLANNPHVPVVVLTDFQLFNQPVVIGADSPLQEHISLAEQITLSYDQSVFSFKFAALNYRSPEKNHYAYKMEGFDQDWTYVDSQRRFATYTNLDPASYTFRVRASNNDGVWNEEGASIKIVITPPWWETWWFRSSAAVVVVGLVFGAFRWRVRSIESRNRWLESQVADRTRRLQKQTVELAQARDKAETANQAKSAFLANMSHELRTPLNGILGYAQILKQDRDLSTRQTDGLNVIRQSGEHLLTLINDILDLSKIEAGKMELYPADVHLAGFLEGIISIIGARAGQKDLLFSYEPQKPLPTGIRVDETRLRQVLLNLLGNAVKFTDRGQVTFRVSELMRKQPDHSLLRFEIKDTGVGMTAEQLERVFLPFEQVGDVKRRAEGTGLGLTLSRRLVRAMGSEVQVKSETGKGSTFWFEVEFPVVETVVAGPASRAGVIVGYKLAAERQIKVLVVDDKPYNRSLIVDLLEPLGFSVAEAGDGQQGVVQAQVLQPDLIVMDLVMPVMTGFEAAQAIRQIPALQDVVIVAASASAFEEDKQASRTAGCDAFIPKPVNVEQFFDLMATHLHLEWIYEEAERGTRDKVPSSTLEPPPPEELALLLQMYQEGDIPGIRERSIQIERMDEKYKPFADRLAQLARDYDEQGMRALLEQFLGAEQ